MANASANSSRDVSSDFDATSIQRLFQDAQDRTSLRSEPRYKGFDNSTGDHWIYPTNYPKREYQYSICKKAIFHNTLVVLPTGLGKTFIASVVMYNVYRWYPTSKIIFMAPARPLVAQQVNACYDIMGIPKEDTVEVTGKQTKKKRHEWWASKRVFFATPQAVLSDLLSPAHNFPIEAIKLVVIDEAHKAKGKYAYTQVIQMISEKNKNFRVLALTATPGRDLSDVREVVQNLLISHIEVRYENSIDVSPYTFKKKIKSELVRLDERSRRVRNEFLQIIDPYIQTLQECNLVSGSTNTMSKGWLIMQQNNFKRICVIEKPPNYQEVSLAFNVAVSMFHSLELLERHGVRMFMNSFVDPENATGFKYFVARNQDLRGLIDRLKEELDCNDISLEHTLSESMLPGDDFYFGHPKFDILGQKLVEHFTETKEAKAMIFTEFRETVFLIEMLLRRHKPLIRARKLVGQGGASGVRAVTQKEQLAVMKEFKAGRCNCLVATCVAEEGIDVGDVDLIVCFDSTSNPTRYVQRIGRTGRKQVGNVLMLLSEGKEYESWKNVVDKKDKTNQKLARSKEIEWVLYKNSPRLVPTDFDPECLEVCFTIPNTSMPPPEPQPSTSREKPITRVKRPNPKKDVASSPKGADLRYFFKPIKDMGPILPITQAPIEVEHSYVTEKSLPHIGEDAEWEALRKLKKELLSRHVSAVPASFGLVSELSARKQEWDEIKENLTEKDLLKWKGAEGLLHDFKRELKSLKVEAMELSVVEPQIESQVEPEFLFPKEPSRKFENTPISKSFQKVAEQKSSTPIRNLSSVINEHHVLSAFGLESLDDLFGDDSPPEICNEKSVEVQEEKVALFEKEETQVLKSLSVPQKIANLVSQDFLEDLHELVPELPIISPKLQTLSTDDSDEMVPPTPKKPPKKKPIDREAISKLVDFDNIFDSDDDLFADIPKTTSMFSPTQKTSVPLPSTPPSSLRFTPQNSIFSPTQQPEQASLKLPSTAVPSLEFQQEASVLTAVSTDPLNEAMNLPDSDEMVCGTPPKVQPRLSRVSLNKPMDISPSALHVSSQQLAQLMLPPRSSPSTAKLLTSPASPMLAMRRRKKRRIASDSEEELPNDPTRTPTSSRPRKSKKRVAHCSFLDFEAAGSSNDDESDGDSDAGSLHDFVVNNETVVDESHMDAHYLRSIKSPVAIGGGFKMPQRLREFRHEDIFSQPLHALEPMSQYEVDGSFVVDDVIEETPEMSELDYAEMIIEAERKSRKRRRKLYS